MAKVCSLEEIKSGVYTLVDLLKINALLDMEIAIQNANAPKGGRKH